MLVLGVDPGSKVTGYGLVKKDNDQMMCIASGHITSPVRSPLYHRIHNIFQKMVEIMTLYRPDQMAVEDVFYAKNVKSSLKLGHARGAVMIAAVQCGVKIFEYSPLEIKKSVVGYGRATKEQVRNMVKILLELDVEPGFDTSDALAAAICHINCSEFNSIIGR